MKTILRLAIAALLLALALPVLGATVGGWKYGFIGTGNIACTSSGLMRPGDACAWTGASGNSPMIKVSCGKASLSVTGTLVAKPYKCKDGTLASCNQIRAVDRTTGLEVAVTLDAADAADWGVIRIPFTLLTVELVSGTGDAIIECGG